MGQLIAGMTGVLVAAMSGVPYPLQNGTTTGNGDTIACPPSFRNHAFLIQTPAGVTAGVIQIETSNSPIDPNTWAPVTTPITVTAGVDILFEYTGILNFVRARISTTISGGSAPSVIVMYEGAKSY